MTARRPIHPTVFERPHHQRIASVLQGLDGELLRTHACSFGGGTAIALRYGEFRESVDIDFLVSDLAHYRQLRLLATGPRGFAALARHGRLLLVAALVAGLAFGRLAEAMRPWIPQIVAVSGSTKAMTEALPASIIVSPFVYSSDGMSVQTSASGTIIQIRDGSCAILPAISGRPQNGAIPTPAVR